MIRSVLAGCRSRVIKVWDHRVGKLPMIILVSGQTLVFADREGEAGWTDLAISHSKAF